MKIGQIYYGNLVIKKDDKKDYSKLKQVTGSVYIMENATLQADALTSIGGSVDIRENATLQADALPSIGSSVYISENATLQADALTSIGGSVYIRKNTTLQADALTSIGSSVDISKNATLQADALTSIGGYVDIRENAKFIKNQDLIINDKNCPAFETKAKTRKIIFESFLKNGYLYADNILAKIIKKNKNVYKIKICGQTIVSYCIQYGENFSHGDTIKEAKDGLLYKISNRDTSKYNDFTKDTKVTLKEAIEMYRVITGACEGGTRYFIENVLTDKKEKYTVQEVIDLTRGQYNHEKLVEFFKA